MKEANQKVEKTQEALKQATKKRVEAEKKVAEHEKKLKTDDDLKAKNDKTLSYMKKAKQMTTDLFKEAKTQTNTTVANTTNSTAPPSSSNLMIPHKEHSMLDKDIVISSGSNTSSSKNVTVPQAIDVTMNKPAESLPVYTQKKWIPNKEEVDDENIKTKPTFAKINPPKKQNASSFTVLSDQKPTLVVQADNELITL